MEAEVERRWVWIKFLFVGRRFSFVQIIYTYIFICMYLWCDILGAFKMQFSKSTNWVPCGRTAKRLRLTNANNLIWKNAKTTLQNYICPQNSPMGRGFGLLAYGLVTYFSGERNDGRKCVCVLRLLKSRSRFVFHQVTTPKWSWHLELSSGHFCRAALGILTQEKRKNALWGCISSNIVWHVPEGFWQG